MTLVADLLAGAFADGTLETVFVTLQPTAPGAPPFRYKVTYLFAGDRAPKRGEGTEEGPVLVLDPEG